MIQVHGIVFGSVGEGGGVKHVAEGLALDENHVGPDGRLCARGGLVRPRFRLRSVIVRGFFHFVEAEIVEEAVDEPRLVEDLGHIRVGQAVDFADHVHVQILGGIDRHHGPGHTADADQTDHQPLPCLRPALEAQAKQKQHDGKGRDQSDPAGVEVELIFPRGLHGLSKQAEVRRHQGILAAFDFDEVDQRQRMENHAREAAGKKEIAQQRIA